VDDFVKRYRQRWPDTRIDVPGNVTYNGYVAMRELLRVVEEVGSTNNIKVIKGLEGRKLAARDRMQHFDAWIDADNHAVQQTVYLAQRNAKPSDNTDYFEILHQVKPQDVVTEDSNAQCKLESYADTPSYEM
jgi:branched-chain amino acid transport system substrate-binding protein